MSVSKLSQKCHKMFAQSEEIGSCCETLTLEIDWRSSWVHSLSFYRDKMWLVSKMSQQSVHHIRRGSINSSEFDRITVEELRCFL